jgi:thioredoxin-like negative regulator of GroEL
MEMKLLESQEQLESLLRPSTAGTSPQPETTCIYFTADWCGACKALDLEAIQGVTQKAQWLKCDIDKNKYSAGYCGVRAIPAFLVIHRGKVAGTLKSNQTAKVSAWMQTVLEDLPQ